MDQRPAHLRFLRVLFLGLVLGAVVILAATIGVDPYASFGVPRLHRFNARKLDSGNDRLLKAAALRQDAYASVFLGTSQAQFGLDPSHAHLADLPGPAYNAGLLRASPYQLLRYLQAADRQGRVQKALLLVDLLMFDASDPAARIGMGFVEGRLPVAADGTQQPFAWVTEVGDLAFSWTALRLAASTVVQQGRPEAEWILASGLQNPRSVERELWRDQGPRLAFEEADRRYALWLRDFTLSRPDEEGLRTPRPLDDFSALLDYARSSAIELTIAIAPTHASYTQLLWALDFDVQIESLKRVLVARVDAESRRQGAPAFALWDFSSPHALTSEPVPSEFGPQARMENYYDRSHFTAALGDLLLGRIAGAPLPGAEDFGVVLTPENIEQELTDARKLHVAYGQRHAADVAAIEARAKAAAAAPRREKHGPKG